MTRGVGLILHLHRNGLLKMLEHVNIDWVWLRDKLNRLVDEINAIRPLPSSTIALDGTPNGTVVRVIRSGQADSSAGGGGGEVWPDGVTWQPMAVIRVIGGVCTTRYIWYWGTAPADTQGDPPALPHS